MNQSFYFVWQKIRFVVLALALVVMGDRALAVTILPTATFSLEVTPSSGSWQLFGTASQGDNFGLTSFGVSLLNVDFPVTLETPFIQYFDGSFFDVGMNFLPSTNNPIGVSQDTTTPMPLVFGFGQTAGTLTAPVAPLGSRNVNYDAKLLLASGTYNNGQGNPLPAFDSGASANVFLDMSGTPVVGGTAVVTNTSVVPEPTTFAMLGLGVGIVVVVGAIRRRP